MADTEINPSVEELSEKETPVEKQKDNEELFWKKDWKDYGEGIIK